MPQIQRIEKVIQEYPGIEGIWDIHRFDMSRSSISDADLEKAFTEQLQMYNAGETAIKFPFGLRPQSTKRHNLVVNGMFDTIIARILGTATSTQDLQARYLAIGSSNSTPTVNQTQLGLEFFRTPFIDAIKVSNKAVLSVFINRLTANGALTTCVTDIGNTTTSFLVAPGTANSFNVGDRIRVTTTSQFNFTNILSRNIVTDIITVDTALADIPLTGDAVVQCWAEAGTFGNGNASGVANTGTMYNRVNALDFVKDDQEVVVIEVQFILSSP